MKTRIAWVTKKLYKPGKISIPVEMSRQQRRVTRRYATLGAGLAPGCPELREVGEKPELTRLAKVEKQVETKMIQCLKIMTDS